MPFLFSISIRRPSPAGACEIVGAGVATRRDRHQFFAGFSSLQHPSQCLSDRGALTPPPRRRLPALTDTCGKSEPRDRKTENCTAESDVVEGKIAQR